MNSNYYVGWLCPVKDLIFFNLGRIYYIYKTKVYQVRGVFLFKRWEEEMITIKSQINGPDWLMQKPLTQK